MGTQGNSSECPQHMFYGELTEIILQLSSNTLLICSSGWMWKKKPPQLCKQKKAFSHLAPVWIGPIALRIQLEEQIGRVSDDNSGIIFHISP